MKTFKVAMSGFGVFVALGLVGQAFGSPTDLEFPAASGAAIAETGEDDFTTRLAEGFPGLTAEPRKNRQIEPVDGDGGFDIVAPRLAVEEGLGGLEWDPSPGYRTRYLAGLDFPAGTSQPQGNNWFTTIPVLTFNAGTNEYYARFDANTYRIYVNAGTGVWVGRYGNLNSKIVSIGGNRALYDIGGKVYTFDSTLRCIEIDGYGGARTTLTHGVNIVVLQKPNGVAGSEVRRITYVTITGTRIDRIDFEEFVNSAWTLYRKIDFTYFEDVPGAVEGSSGDLIGIQDQKLLSPTNTWSYQNWVFKYYTGTYNQTTNPGNPYQVKAVIGPQSYREFVRDNPTLNIYQRTADQLESPTNYLDRRLKYYSDKRLLSQDIKSGCGCGGGEGLYSYEWPLTIPSPPADLNTWAMWMKITMPNGSARMFDYNKYGQMLNSIAQEVATNPLSRRWIETSRHDTTGRLTDTYSVKACTSYDDTNHVVTTNTTAGQRFIYAYDANSALNTVKLRDPSNGNLNFQLKKVFSFLTSGNRRRFTKTSQTVYPIETTTDTGGKVTSFSYTFHASDALAVKLKTTTLPAVATGENGSGSSILLKDYFEPEGLHTWTKDGDGFVHYTGFDPNRHILTKRVVNLNTSSPPPGVPSSPDPTFNTTSGLNLVTDMEYDSLRRMTKQILPDFVDNTSTTVNITKRWWYTKLSSEELVTIAYPHLGATFYPVALTLTHTDVEGHVLTSALGNLTVGNVDLSDDFDPAQSTLDAGFHGTIIRRTEYTYLGDKVSAEKVWTAANNTNATKYTTSYTYDTSGLRVTTTNPVGTISRLSYDVLNRRKTTKIGTVDGGPGDNMTSVEDIFYDDEEDASNNVGDGNVTRVNRYTDAGVARTTDSTYDYRQRLTQVDEPLSVRETRSYTNRNQLSLVQRYDTSSGSVLMAKTESFFDAWGQLYETREHGVSGGVASGYASVRTWRNGRGQVIKELSRGKVFNKTQYDGAGRVTNQAVSYDTAETTYAAAGNLTGDTVIQETRYTLDKLGDARLVGTYERRHDGTGTGGLTVGTSGNGRAQYVATWHDTLHRTTHTVNYGTNLGSDMTDRPAGNPPSSSSTSSLVAMKTYTIKSEVLRSTDPQGIITERQYDDPGRLLTRIENFVDGDPGPGPETDQDRTTEFTYDGENHVLKTTARASGADEVTENVFGVTKGASFPDSKIASNDLLKLVKYPDPTTGQPSTNAVDQESFAYNAQGERIWRKDQQSSQHTIDYDARGRRIHDRVNVLGTGIEGSIRRVSTTYDALDRPVKVSSFNDPTVGFGTVQNEVQYDYSRYNTISKLYQEWAGAVNTGTSRKVQYAYAFPTDGTTAVRRTSTSYTDGTTVIDDVYNSGTDDIISRLSGQQKAGLSLFQESYLGLGRLVKRQFSVTNQPQWTLIGTDPTNNDNYVGLDRFGRIDDLVVKTALPLETFNRYTYAYNFNSQVTVREDQVGNVGGSFEFDETFVYDGLGRLTDHKRGAYNAGTMNPIRLHECWTLDRSGNPSPYSNGSSSDCLTTYTASYNHSNEISSWSLGSVAHNDAGDLTTKGNYTFIYDAWNRLKEVQVLLISVAQYQYNGLGQKIVSALTSPARYYYYSDRWQILEERDVDTGAVLQNYAWGTQYIDDLAVVNLLSPAPVAFDANFNVVTRFSSGGPVSSRIVYDGYGKPKQVSADWSTFGSITEDLHLFTGRLYVKQHEQYDFRHRTQDPQLGRFVQRDPIGIWGDLRNYGNGYSYVGSDPVNRTDPLGLGFLSRLRDLVAMILTPSRCVSRFVDSTGSGIPDSGLFQSGYWGWPYVDMRWFFYETISSTGVEVQAGLGGQIGYVYPSYQFVYARAEGRITCAKNQAGDGCTATCTGSGQEDKTNWVSASAKVEATTTGANCSFLATLDVAVGAGSPFKHSASKTYNFKCILITDPVYGPWEP